MATNDKLKEYLLNIYNSVIEVQKWVESNYGVGSVVSISKVKRDLEDKLKDIEHQS